jgi:hypothetical protein
MDSVSLCINCCDWCTRVCECGSTLFEILWLFNCRMEVFIKGVTEKVLIGFPEVSFHSAAYRRACVLMV